MTVVRSDRQESKREEDDERGPRRPPEVCGRERRRGTCSDRSSASSESRDGASYVKPSQKRNGSIRWRGSRMHASSASRENRACGEDATICTYCEDESMSPETGKYTLRHAKLDSTKRLEFKRKVGHAESGRVYLPLQDKVRCRVKRRLLCVKDEAYRVGPG